jgi:hypothetical protein
MRSRSFCAVLGKLVSANSSASSRYYAATNALLRIAGTDHPSEIAAAKKECEDALRECEETTRAIKQHRLTHDCSQSSRDLYTILSVSRDHRLLLQRNERIALAGFRVVSPRFPEHAHFLAATEDADVVVLGNSVVSEVRAQIIKRIRRLSPRCGIIFVFVGAEQQEPLADISIDVTTGDEPLVHALEQLFARNAESTRGPAALAKRAS